MSSSLNVLPCQVFPIQTSISPPLKIILFQCPLSMFSALNIFSLNIFSSQCLPSLPPSQTSIFFSQYFPFSIFFPLDVLNSQCILLLIFNFLNVFLLNLSSLLKPQYLFFSIFPLSMSYVLPFQFLPSQYDFLKVPPPWCLFFSTSSLLNVFPLNIIFFKCSLDPWGFWEFDDFSFDLPSPTTASSSTTIGLWGWVLATKLVLSIEVSGAAILLNPWMKRQ